MKAGERRTSAPRKAFVSAMLMVAMCLPATSAWALDIDRIEVRSQVGEPLRAEIPLILDNPEELKSLQVGLASATTFARIGLARPQGAVGDLRFEVDRNPRAPRIRVSTGLPVQQEFLTFLIQLEWEGGRMVREFSLALAGAPQPEPAAPEQAGQTAPATAPPTPGLSPTASLPATPTPIELPADTAAVEPAPVLPPAQPMPVPIASAVPGVPTNIAASPAAAPVPAAPTPVAQPASANPQAAPIPVFDRRAGRTIRGDVASPAVPTASALAVPAAIPATTTAARPIPVASTSAADPSTQSLGPIAAGQNLTRIARELAAPGQSLDQVMVALIRANPQAFAQGNIHQLQRGARLRVPSAAEIAQYNAVQAEAVVREQTQLWLDGKAAQTPVLAGLPAPTTVAATPAPTLPSQVSTPPAQGAHLQILPPQAGSATQAGNQGGAQQAADAVANAYAQRAQEITDLQQRVGQLEALNRNQQALIESQQAQLGISGAMPSRFGWLGWLLAVVSLSLIAGFWLRGLRDRRLHGAHGPTWHAKAAVEAPRTAEKPR